MLIEVSVLSYVRLGVVRMSRFSRNSIHRIGGDKTAQPLDHSIVLVAGSGHLTAGSLDPNHRNLLIGLLIGTNIEPLTSSLHLSQLFHLLFCHSLQQQALCHQVFLGFLNYCLSLLLVLYLNTRKLWMPFPLRLK